MLFEPEATIVSAWLQAGGQLQRIPFGVSGKVWCFAQTARQSGAWGAFKRYGGKHVPRETYPLIAIGELTVPQSRVEIAWLTLRAHGPLCANQLAQVLEIYPVGARKAMEALVQIHRAEFFTDNRIERARATGEQPPHWTDCLAAQRQAA